jgi:galactose oxidase-like protein/PKD domain-containing protein
LLLPDATVATAGSNPQRGVYDNHIEIYSPAYLFDANGNLAKRPVITGAPSAIGYNSVPFQVQTPDASTIASVVLIKPGSDTHAYDMEQRLLGLTFTATSGTLTVNAPPNSNLAPPGYYMLFVLNQAGVPSVAKFVQVSQNPTDQPPNGTITAPTGDVTTKVGQSVNFAGTASDSDGSVKSYSWFFPEGTPDDSAAPNPGAVVFSSPGTYVASLTAVDDKGVNDPSPPPRTVTVQPLAGTIAIDANKSTDGPTAATTISEAVSTTTRNGSWVVGVGEDYDNPISRTPGSTQMVLHQYLSPVGDTFWVQKQSTAIPASGTLVTINDTAPITDRFNLSICEILPVP